MATDLAVGALRRSVGTWRASGLVARRGAAVLVQFLTMFWLLFAPAAMAAETKTVLVLFANNRLLPANVEIDRGLRETLTNSTHGNVELYFEFLDEPAFSGQPFEATIATYLREKYTTRQPQVIVVAGEFALSFLLRHRPPLFPGVPVVYL